MEKENEEKRISGSNDDNGGKGDSVVAAASAAAAAAKRTGERKTRSKEYKTSALPSMATTNTKHPS